MSRVTHVNAPRHTCEWVMTDSLVACVCVLRSNVSMMYASCRLWMRQVTYECVMSYMSASCHMRSRCVEVRWSERSLQYSTALLPHLHLPARCVAVCWSVLCSALQCVAVQGVAAPHDTHCNTLQYTATFCNKLQSTATHCKTPQITAAHYNAYYNSLQHTTTCYNTLQHTTQYN